MDCMLSLQDTRHNSLYSLLDLLAVLSSLAMVGHFPVFCAGFPALLHRIKLSNIHFSIRHIPLHSNSLFKYLTILLESQIVVGSEAYFCKTKI